MTTLRMTSAGVLLVALTCLGCESSTVPILSAAVTARSKMPFHGPGGAGSEPMSITFAWSIRLQSSDGPDCSVDRLTTTLSEPVSATSLAVTSEPHRMLPGGGSATFEQQQAGFFSSALYSRAWNGSTRVGVSCEGGQEQELVVTFVIP
jgi:hypothetical protein